MCGGFWASEPWSPKAGEVLGFPGSLEMGLGVRHLGIWLQRRTEGEAETWQKKTYLFKEMEQCETWEEGGRKEDSSLWP